jgi:hypothetical protein
MECAARNFQPLGTRQPERLWRESLFRRLPGTFEMKRSTKIQTKTGRSAIGLVALVLTVSFVGCSGGIEKRPTEETSNSSVPPAAAPASPIDPSTAGEINGQVFFEGPAPPRSLIRMNAVPACKMGNNEPVYSEEVYVNENETLRNVFVYVKEGLGNRTFAVPAEPVVLDQKGCQFRPHVLGIMARQKLQINNGDPLSHNVHPVPSQNREWNQSLPPGNGNLIEEFARPEIMIPVKCNVHSWMKAYIGVVPSPFYAVTDDRGMFTLKGLPPGDYTIGAWQERYGTQDQKVMLGPQEKKTVRFGFKG